MATGRPDDAAHHLLKVHANVATLGAWGGAPRKVIEAAIVEDWHHLLADPDEDTRELMATR